MFAWLRRRWQLVGSSPAAVKKLDHRLFAGRVTAAFDYLVDRYGFERQPLQIIAYDRFVTFEKPGVKVIVQQELGSAPYVTLAAPKSIAPGLRREFGLHELEQEMEKLGRYQRTVASPATVEESLSLLASTLERVGVDVLYGDFSVLFARLRRHVAAIGKSR